MSLSNLSQYLTASTESLDDTVDSAQTGDVVDQTNTDETTGGEATDLIEGGDAVDTDEVELEREEWIELPQNQTEELETGLRTETALGELADRVEDSDQPGLEAYNWAFQALGAVTGMGAAQQVSLESFGRPGLQRTGLATAIRKHRARLSMAINASLEDYQETFNGSLGQIVTSIRQSASELHSAVGNITSTSAKPKAVNHSKIWQMLHVNGTFVTDLNAALRTEKAGLDKILRAIRVGAQDGEMPPLSNTSLMFNTQVTVSNGRAHFEQNSAPMPKRSPAPRGTGSRWRWTIAGFLLFNIVGAAAGYFIGKGRDQARADRNSVREEVTPRQIEEVKTFLNEIAGFEKYVTEIEKVANEIARQIETEDKETRKELRRKYFPVMDALEMLGKHIAELIYGGTRLAQAAGGR